MSYESEDDFEDEYTTAANGGDTVMRLWRNYMMDPYAWDMARVKEQIEAIIALRTPALQAAKANKPAADRARRAAKRTARQIAWNARKQ